MGFEVFYLASSLLDVQIDLEGQQPRILKIYFHWIGISYDYVIFIPWAPSNIIRGSFNRY